VTLFPLEEQGTSFLSGGALLGDIDIDTLQQELSQALSSLSLCSLSGEHSPLVKVHLGLSGRGTPLFVSGTGLCLLDIFSLRTK